MSIWFVFWALLSSFLLFFLGWTVYIIVQQKRSWKAFSAANTLRFKTSKFMDSPEMEGVIEGYAFSFFTAEHPTTDVRGTRKVTAIEVILNSHLPFEGGVASHGMIPVLKSMGFIAEIQPTHEGWNTACLATTTHRYAMEAYLTPERVQALMTLLKIPRAWITLIFKGETALLRIDTPSPLEQLAQLEKLKKILLKTAAILELKEGEIGRLKAEMTRATPKAEAPAPLSASTSALTLELEEDEEKEESETSED